MRSGSGCPGPYAATNRTAKSPAVAMITKTMPAACTAVDTAVKRLPEPEEEVDRRHCRNDTGEPGAQRRRSTIGFRGGRHVGKDGVAQGPARIRTARGSSFELAIDSSSGFLSSPTPVRNTTPVPELRQRNGYLRGHQTTEVRDERFMAAPPAPGERQVYRDRIEWWWYGRFLPPAMQLTGDNVPEESDNRGVVIRDGAD